MIRCVSFDFDGTLVQSNEIKRQAFFDATAHLERADGILTDLFGSGFKGDRYQLLGTLADMLYPGDRDMAERVATDCVERYSRQCHERIVACPEVAGASDALRHLHGSDIPCYVNSATPTAYLRQIIEERRLSRWFRGVMGAPAAKPDNLERILSAEGIVPAELVVVGDGEDDRDAARDVGCHFLGIGPAGSTRLAETPDLMVDLVPLPSRLERLNDVPLNAGTAVN